MKTMNQHKLTAALILVLGYFSLTANVAGQTVKVDLKVNATVEMMQVTPFEVVPENWAIATGKGFSGRTHSVNTVGTFTIRGKENQDILVKLDAPEVLTNKENQTMPFNMKLAWHNTPAGDLNNLKWSNDKSNVFNLMKSAEAANGKNVKDNNQQAYLYLKSTAEVPVHAASPFEGNVNLTIEY